MNKLVIEKTLQANQILKELDIDVWLTFVRETSAGGDPVLPLIYGTGLTWQSAIILTKTDERIAIVGGFETDTAERISAFTEVIPYHEAIKPVLLEVLDRLQPKTIALNYSEDDVYADGLSLGLYRVLLGYLEGTEYPEKNRVCRAGDLSFTRPQDSFGVSRHQNCDCRHRRDLPSRF